MAQAVSRRLPTAAARVRDLAKSCEICGGQNGNGAGFLRVLRFHLPILISPIAPQSPSSIIRGWYNRPNNVRRTKWTQSHSTPQKTRDMGLPKLGRMADMENDLRRQKEKRWK
jgi:hypothetical protein